MTTLASMVAAFKANPNYAMMRGAARFRSINGVVKGAKGLVEGRTYRALVDDLKARLRDSVFAEVDPERFIADLNRDGCAFGLTLPAADVEAIRAYAAAETVYADRNPGLGFPLPRRLEAEKALGKPILVAQYFNTEAQCPAIAKLRADPFLHYTAARYFGSAPFSHDPNLWWTFATNASEEDKIKHAHRFHSDVDDFAILKFFFYITDVAVGDGSHVLVKGSNRERPYRKFSDRLVLRRYRDDEITSFYRADRIVDIGGPAGTGFAEDTFCIHKGNSPFDKPRLLLQFQFTLFDYDAIIDRVPPEKLK
ncbi:MAG TPA: hypothetical protein VKV96_14770, partial [Roseiarcus sp.]|nr:hypothetical protein [Roseiarcus sp.]